MLTAERRRLNEMMAALADGDRFAFDPVYELVSPIVSAFTQRALRDGPDAEDVAQTALLKLFSRAHLYDRERDALPWILAIAANEIRTHRRKTQRRREEAGSIEPECLAPSPESAAIERDLLEAAKDCLGQLRPADRETILAASGALSRPDIPGATFRKRLERALGRLRSVWSASHE